jgi:hypothetical protein
VEAEGGAGGVRRWINGSSDDSVWCRVRLLDCVRGFVTDDFRGGRGGGVRLVVGGARGGRAIRRRKTVRGVVARMIVGLVARKTIEGVVSRRMGRGLVS